MTGNIAHIDYVAGSYSEQEGGITVFLRDGTQIAASVIEFSLDYITKNVFYATDRINSFHNRA